MLIPLSQKVLETLIPLMATSTQYKYCWGKPADVLRRFLYSIAGVVAIAILGVLFPEEFNPVFFLLAVVAFCYWLWVPIYAAWQRNREYRRYEFGGFWTGEVLDKFITEEVVRTQETVDKKGELVVIENREKRLNLEIGDETGFATVVQVTLQKRHRDIRPGDWVELVMLSNRSDLSRIMKITDVFIPDAKLWVSDYPYLRRDIFLEVSRRLREGDTEYDPIPPKPAAPPRRSAPVRSDRPRLPRYDR
ncbi:MAG: hypothetical protein WBA57_26210 [Elainellaceae cyanobacterium]